MRRELCGAALFIGLALPACQQKMAKNGHLIAYAPDPFLPDSSTALTAPEGTVARESAPESAPPPVSPSLLRRGRERYMIYCAPCHGDAGYGDGMIVRRGFLAPPSYHSDRLRQAPAAHFFDVITNGFGAMYSYADRVGVEDRWAIVAYIRALQLSQNAPVGELDPGDRQKLEEARK